MDDARPWCACGDLTVPNAAWERERCMRIAVSLLLISGVFLLSDSLARHPYLVVGIRTDGHKDVLGLWLAETEGAKFWLSILNELKNRGVEDILILCADGLSGLPEAVEAAFPRTVFQTCIVHMVRSSTRFISWKDRKRVCTDLRKIYTA